MKTISLKSLILKQLQECSMNSIRVIILRSNKMQKNRYTERSNYIGILFFSSVMILYGLIGLYMDSYLSQDNVSYLTHIIAIILGAILITLRIKTGKSLLTLSVTIFLFPQIINIFIYLFRYIHLYIYVKFTIILMIAFAICAFLSIIFTFLFEKFRKTITKILSIILVLSQCYASMLFASSIGENASSFSLELIPYVCVALYIITVIVGPVFIICVSLKKISNTVKVSELKNILSYNLADNFEIQGFKKLYDLNLLSKDEYLKYCLEELNLSNVTVICDKCNSEIKGYATKCPSCKSKTNYEVIFNN